MPLFITESELQAAGSDVALVVERADAYIQDLLQQLEASKARADAAAITTEQRTAVVEQKFMAMSSRFKEMENEKTQLESYLQRRSAELAQVQAQLHKFELESMKQDSERERIMCELNELRKARRELLDVAEQKNSELNEKNTYIKSYLDKIVLLTDERSNLEGKLHEAEAELGRSQAAQARLAQEKELLEQHNSWLNEELTDKLDTLLKERRSSSELEMELRAKLGRTEQLCKDTEESLQHNKEMVKDLESRLNQTREDLKFTRENAELKENHLSLEVETASKLVDLYKQSTEELSKKATDLEGVIKALEVHLNQVEEESKKNLEKEVETRQIAEKNAAEAHEKLEKIEKELESFKKAKEEDSIFLLSNVSSKESEQELAMELHELHKEPSLPIVPSGISGTALAATLIRDGWSITKIYVKYQEAVDAWRHEKQERKHSQALLQRVLQEIEQRAEQILDERAEHARMVEAYALMEEKLHSSVEEQNLLENHIRELKAELRKKERDLNSFNQECMDLQTQVATLLKECTDIRHRANGQASQLECVSRSHESAHALTTTDAVVSDRLLTFKDINELVQQNSQLRAVVRSLGHHNEERELEMKEAFELELKRRTDEAAQKVSMILRKSEEQTHLISSLQGTVGMYKRLYDEALKSNNVPIKDNSIIAINENHGDDVRTLVIKSEEETEKVQKEASERLSALENDVAKARQEANSARMERDRLIVEATYAREQLQTILKDSENKRKEMDSVLARNVEFSQIITDYQRRLRENAEHVQSVEEKCRRLSVEVSVLEREKELISNAEKRASQELSSLSDRVHRLQATLDNIHTVEEVQESVRMSEKKKLEEEVNRMQKEWVEMKHELDSERAHSRHLSNERDEAVKQAMSKIESISRELADALSKVSIFETRALVAEARCKELESNIKKTEEKALRVALRKGGGKDINGGDVDPEAEMLSQLEQAKEEIEHLKEELDASKSHSDQYKQLAQLNENALLKVEDAHNRFKEEAEKTKEVMNSELSDLRDRITELEKIVSEKEKELMAVEANSVSVRAAVEKDCALLRESESEKRLLLEQSEERIKALKAEVDKEHQMWRTAQSNYERQVLLQADTIRELTTASENNENLRKELEELRSKAQIATSDLASLRVSWEMEKATILSEHEKLNRKIKELEEQNRILLDRVESKHINLAECVKLSGDATTSTEHAESDLQDVIRYLRRSKETSDVEISLLKQERSRLQKQLESALRASEEAQANLRRECENTRVTLCSEEEFKSLQSQVREMTLLRESNSQLRMENKRNFEECQSLRGSLQSKEEEVESLQKLLRERELETESLMKDVDLHKAEVTRWENRSSQLLQKMKAFDIEEHNKVKSDLQSAQETLKLREAEIDTSRAEIVRHQELLHKLEQEMSSKDEKISDLEKRIQETEAAAKAENDKLRRHAIQFKRRLDVVTKEKEEQLKQMDELKTGSSKRSLGESQRSEAEIRQEISAQHELALKENENLLKEKETRIQTLERTLEKEREELRKEKARRSKDQKLYYDTLQKQQCEKTKLLEEVNALKREKESFSENPQSKKLGRKIIRPKMDSPVEPQVQPEVSDPGTEATIELPESDLEAREDTKPVVTDISENVTTTTALIVASTTDDVIGIRKRSSAEAHGSVEECPGQSSKHDMLPVQKKQKGLDLKPIAMVSESQMPLKETETIVTTDATKSGGMDLDQGSAGDSPAMDNKLSDQSTMMVETEPVSSNILPVSTETIATKRSRIVRSEALQPNVQRGDGVIAGDDQNMPETSSLKEAAGQSIAAGDDHMHGTETSVPSPLILDVPHTATEIVSQKDAEQTAPDTSDSTVLQTQLQDIVAVSEIDATDNLVVDLSDTPDQIRDSTSIPVMIEMDTAEKEIIMEPSPVVEGSVEAGEGEGEGEPPTDGVDIEDGEIEPEDADDGNGESTQPPLIENEEKNQGNASTEVSDEVAQQQEEQSQPLVSEPSQNENQSASGSNESQNPLAADQKTEDKTTPKVLIRQVKRGTTINISERARERSIGRRSGIPPPSPGRRTTRWTKRTAAAQRGKEGTNDVETEGHEEDKTADAQQTGSPAQRDQE